MTRVRNSHGMMLGIVIVVLVLLMFGTAAVALLMAASWRSTLRVDADTEAANVLASAINIVDALATGRHDSGQIRTPEDACIALHTNYTDPNMPVPPPSCPTGPTPDSARVGCRCRAVRRMRQQRCWKAAGERDSLRPPKRRPSHRQNGGACRSGVDYHPPSRGSL